MRRNVRSTENDDTDDDDLQFDGKSVVDIVRTLATSNEDAGRSAAGASSGQPDSDEQEGRDGHQDEEDGEESAYDDDDEEYIEIEEAENGEHSGGGANDDDYDIPHADEGDDEDLGDVEREETHLSSQETRPSQPLSQEEADRTTSGGSALSDESESDIEEDCVEPTRDAAGSSVTRDGVYSRGWNIAPRRAMDLLQVSGKDKGAMQIRKLRDKRLEQLDGKHRKLVVRVFKNMIAKLATSVLPTDPKALVAEAFALLDTSNREKNVLQESICKCLRGSVEKRLLRSMAVGMFSKPEVKLMISNDVKSYSDAVAVAETRPISSWVRSENVEVRHARVTSLRERYKSSNVRRTYERALNDWSFFTEHGRLPKLRRVVTRVSDLTIEQCVRFIYCPRNREILASGSKQIRLSDESTVVLPQVRRRTSMTEIFEDYRKMRINIGSEIPAMRRTAFLQVIGRLTSGQFRMKTCVDYYLGILVFENTKKLERIVEVRVTDGRKREQIKKKITAVADYLKHDFMLELRERGDAAVATRRALVWDDADVDVGGDTSRLDNVLKPFQLIQDIKDVVVENGDDIHGVLDDSGNKFKLFMAHQLRCFVQQTVFAETDKWLQDKPPETAAIITLDFKQKFIPKKFREQSADYFGKKGMSWHGAVATYKPSVDNDDEMTDSAGRRSRVYSTKNINMDHVCRNATDAKAAMVASVIELVSRRLKQELPNVDEVIIRSDNARNYSNRLIPVIAPFIFAAYGIRLVRYVFCEPQDGKGPADLHFAGALHFVDRYIESLKRDVVTPKDLVDALNYADGMIGTVAELYDVNYTNASMKKWLDGLKVDGQLSMIGRVNDIVYIYNNTNRNEIGAYTKTYKFSDEVHWKFMVAESICLDGEYVAPDDTYVGEEVGEEVDGEADCDEASDEAIEELNHPNIRYFADLQLGENGPTFASDDADEVVRRSHLDVLCSAQTIFTGSVTGVRLLETVDIVRQPSLQQRVVRIGDHSSALYDDEEEDTVADVDEFGDKPIKRMGNSLICKKCGQAFRSVLDVRKHVNTCKVSNDSTMVADRATRMAAHFIANSSVIICRSASENPALVNMEVCDKVRRETLFPPMWAARSSDGAALGRNYVGPFKEKIRVMVLRGHYDKSVKMSGAQMYEQLVSEHPDRFDIPSVYHIKSHIQTVLKRIKKARTAMLSGETRLPGRQNELVPEEYAKVMEEILTEDIKTLPRNMMALLITRMRLDPAKLPEDFPEKDKIARKTSTLKTKLKNHTK